MAGPGVLGSNKARTSPGFVSSGGVFGVQHLTVDDDIEHAFGTHVKGERGDDVLIVGE
ncbi:MAG: hypothetical protein R2706_20945 [Acidimicrobiales bacterium]